MVKRIYSGGYCYPVSYTHLDVYKRQDEYKETVDAESFKEFAQFAHEHHNEPDISLKIGRYLFPFCKVQNEKPKSELTLDNEELNALSFFMKYVHITFICSIY